MAKRSAALAFVGRLLFAFLFISSGIQKLQTFNLKTGGPVMDLMAPKLDAFLDHVHHYTKIDLPVEKEIYPILLAIAIGLELVGGVLYLMDSSIGAVLLLLFLGAVTPTIHAFWDVKDKESQMVELIMFMKNVALAGSLITYIGGQPRKLTLE